MIQLQSTKNLTVSNTEREEGDEIGNWTWKRKQNRKRHTFCIWYGLKNAKKKLIEGLRKKNFETFVDMIHRVNLTIGKRKLFRKFVHES